MKYEEYLNKAIVLIREAKIDIENSCYNKAVSAIWFSIEATFRAILNYYRHPIPSKSGALIAGTISFIHKQKLLSQKEIVRLSLASSLYTLRNEIDHKRTLASTKTIRRAIQYAREILLILRKFMRSRAPEIEETLDRMILEIGQISK